MLLPHQLQRDVVLRVPSYSFFLTRTCRQGISEEGQGGALENDGPCTFWHLFFRHTVMAVGVLTKADLTPAEIVQSQVIERERVRVSATSKQKSL